MTQFLFTEDADSPHKIIVNISIDGSYAGTLVLFEEHWEELKHILRGGDYQDNEVALVFERKKEA